MYDTVSDALEKGNCVIVHGTYQMDDWEKDYCLDMDGLATVKKKPGKTDNAEETRIELHLHTSMSQMDAVSPVKSVVNRAFEWGHKAVAITDHGVVQAFPEAMLAAAKKDIKVIYGMEAYFVDDTARAVYGDDVQQHDPQVRPQSLLDIFKHDYQNLPSRLRLMKIISMQARKPSVQIGPATMMAFFTKAPDRTFGAL